VEYVSRKSGRSKWPWPQCSAAPAERALETTLVVEPSVVWQVVVLGVQVVVVVVFTE
jgi:hypothetical protein